MHTHQKSKFENLYSDSHFQYLFQKTDVPELIRFFEKKMGWIYIAKSQDHSFLKIGRTSKNPLERAKTLSTVGVLHDYEIIFSIKVFNQYFVEKNVHQQLKKYQISKEFFSAPIEKCIETIEKVYQKECSILEPFFLLELLKSDIHLMEYAMKNKD
jgi:hypothetical protein